MERRRFLGFWGRGFSSFGFVKTRGWLYGLFGFVLLGSPGTERVTHGSWVQRIVIGLVGIRWALRLCRRKTNCLLYGTHGMLSTYLRRRLWRTPGWSVDVMRVCLGRIWSHKRLPLLCACPGFAVVLFHDDRGRCNSLSRCFVT